MQPSGIELCVHISAQILFNLYKGLHLQNHAYLMIYLGILCIYLFIYF